jgi:preprotein translocase subunit SecF
VKRWFEDERILMESAFSIQDEVVTFSRISERSKRGPRLL